METEIAPRCIGKDYASPSELFNVLSTGTDRIALQTGEPGPFAQCISGLDVAVWDMIARRAGAPLFRALGGMNPTVPVYASGINPTGVANTGARLVDAGHRRLKLKVGFDAKGDLSNAQTLRRHLGANGLLMVDANQAWTPETAVAAIRTLQEVRPYWVEEPIMANAALIAWQTLRETTNQPLAGGENLASIEAFEGAIEGGWLDVIQPDICKWGGITQALSIFQATLAAGKLTCPHSLGGGVALAGSLHLWAGVDGTGFVEMDCNPNALREDIFPTTVRDGTVTLGEDPGLGVDTDRLDRFFAR